MGKLSCSILDRAYYTREDDVIIYVADYIKKHNMKVRKPNMAEALGKPSSTLGHYSIKHIKAENKHYLKWTK